MSKEKKIRELELELWKERFNHSETKEELKYYKTMVDKFIEIIKNLLKGEK